MIIVLGVGRPGLVAMFMRSPTLRDQASETTKAH
jgi:hypothetical protein